MDAGRPEAGGSSTAAWTPRPRFWKLRCTSRRIEISRPGLVHRLDLTTIPNPGWLRSGTVSAGQQAFGNALLDVHPFLLVPSVVSTRSWNLVIDVTSAQGMFALKSAEDFSLDTRLHPA